MESLSARIEAQPFFRALAALSCGYHREDDLQKVTFAIMRAHGLEPRREVRAGESERMDVFGCWEGLRICIECKVSPHGLAAVRQCIRYAEHADVVILLSTKVVNSPLRNHTLRTTDNREVPFFIVELWRNL